MTKSSWLVWILHLIGWESGARFLDQSQSKVKQMHSRIPHATQLEISLLNKPLLVCNVGIRCCKALSKDVAWRNSWGSSGAIPFKSSSGRPAATNSDESVTSSTTTSCGQKSDWNYIYSINRRTPSSATNSSSVIFFFFIRTNTLLSKKFLNELRRHNCLL